MSDFDFFSDDDNEARDDSVFNNDSDGYQSDGRVPPNMELITDLISQDGRTVTEIWRAAGLDPSKRSFNKWNRTGICNFSSLEALAKVLPGEYSGRDLIKKSEEQPRSCADPINKGSLFREFICDLIESNEFRDEVIAEGGFENVSVLNFAYNCPAFQKQVRLMNFGYLEEKIELLKLVRKGILRFREQPSEMFIVQKWTKTEADKARRCRVEIDKLDARYAKLLQLTDKNQFTAIKQVLERNVRILHETSEALADNPTIFRSRPVVDADLQCHRAFSFGDRFRLDRFDSVNGRHMQPFYYLVHLHQRIEKLNIELPENVFSIPCLVSTFCTDWKEIYEGFINVDPSDEVEMEQWLNLFDKHSRCSFSHIDHCLRVINNHKS